mmetsp:Transcript_483/g.973  ORF Transcript_483/g.973 Transcript_483/m.973 type:complete len:215 (-) Transcript_483:65-709(-)
MPVVVRAFFGGELVLDEVFEKHPVCGRRIRVVVRPRGHHERDIVSEDGGWVEGALLFGGHLDDAAGEDSLQRVVPRRHALVVVVRAPCLPELPLSVVDHVPDDRALVTSAAGAARVGLAHDRAGQVQRRGRVSHDGTTVVGLDLLLPPVVPVRWHRQRICYQQPVQRSLHAISQHRFRDTSGGKGHAAGHNVRGHGVFACTPRALLGALRLPHR